MRVHVLLFELAILACLSLARRERKTARGDAIEHADILKVGQHTGTNLQQSTPLAAPKGESEPRIGSDGSGSKPSKALGLMLLLASASALRLPALARQATRLPPIRMQETLGTLFEPSETKPPPERIVAAVETAYQRQAAGARLNAADLAAQAGISVSEAERGMKELAGALAGADGLSVAASSKGDLLYTFPADVRGELASRSSAAQLRDTWNKAKPYLQTAGRVTFGVTLFVSIAVIYLAITALQSASDEREDRRDGGGMMMGGGYGGGFGGGFGFGYWSPLDLLFPPWPYGYYGYGYFSPPPEMSLPEAIFSFVFGDGNPNAGMRPVRLKALAEVIRSNNGAVVAEQLAPYLDPPENANPTSYNVDESWVLPAVTDLGGRPEVAGDGTIVYVFDDLTVSAIASDANLILVDPGLATIDSKPVDELVEMARERRIPIQGGDADMIRDDLRDWATREVASLGGMQSLFPGDYLEERQASFSNAEDGQLFAAGALGALNFAGAAYLGNLLAGLPAGYQLAGTLGLVQSAYPFLLAYAVAYVTIPGVRYLKLQADNAEVAKRNSNRRKWTTALRRSGDEVRKRLSMAKNWGKKTRLIRDSDLDYDSSKDLQDQQVTQQPDLDDFDKRLRDAGK